MTFEQYSIRHVTMEDLPYYFELIDQNRSRLESFFAGTVAITQTLEATETHLKDIIGKNKENNYFSFVVVDKTTGKPVASIQVKNVDWSVPKAELGYFIDKKYEGKGMISKALSKVIDHCFDELKFVKLYIRTHSGNVPSRKVAEKNKFILEGTIRKDYKTTAGELVDLMYYGLVKDDQGA